MCKFKMLLVLQEKSSKISELRQWSHSANAHTEKSGNLQHRYQTGVRSK